ncbi:MAG: ABC transporter permease [Desulfobacterales bacterium]|nr:ABC transporter permease [Desulfobacterales bacterium]MBF0396767.1 ABC transporter permease [Desulfobacterales bacterium]
MNFKRFWAMFIARNNEFFRDKSSVIWNFIFPFLLIGGFAIIFGDNKSNGFKVGLFPSESKMKPIESLNLPKHFKESPYLRFIGFGTKEEGIKKLKYHKIDFLLTIDDSVYLYWINESSQQGYILEKIFLSSIMSQSDHIAFKREKVEGREIRYIDWLFPGIIGMNITFSALWGVGYVIIRYRKNGVLKRLKATPLTALEYLTSQMFSRVFIIMFSVIVVWFGSDMLFHFRVEGRYINLIILWFIGTLCSTSIGLLIAARGTSEEFTSRVIEFVGWPVMFLSEVWFSIEGSPAWVKFISKLSPLTHLLNASRKIVNEGAGFMEIKFELFILVSIIISCLIVGSLSFSWNE